METTRLISQNPLTTLIKERDNRKCRQQEKENQEKRRYEMEEALVDFLIYKLNLGSDQINSFLSTFYKIDLGTKMRIYRAILKRERCLKRFHFFYSLWANLPIGYCSYVNNKKINKFRIKILEEKISELESQQKQIEHT